jgi:activator of HSP90 ATPase
MKTRDLKQTVLFAASPHDVYELLMDSKKHAAFTGAAARISRRLGGKISAYDGYISGKNLELVADEKIVQAWHGADWPEGHESLVTFQLQPKGEKCQLVFTHKGIPEDKFNSIKQGWIDYYWNPMKALLAEVKPSARTKAKRAGRQG